jgi:hypothetical protein
MYLMVLMVHNWFKNALYQSCTISTIRKWFLLHSISTIRNGFCYTAPKFFSFYVCGGNQYPQRLYHLCPTCILCADHNSRASVYESVWDNIRLRFDCIPSVMRRWFLVHRENFFWTLWESSGLSFEREKGGGGGYPHSFIFTLFTILDFL